MAPEELGENVLIVGGGLVGCELAMHLTALGKRVTVVEMAGELAPEGYRLHREWLLMRLRLAADCRTNTRCVELNKGSVTVENAQGERETLTASSIVYALGMKARMPIVDTLRKARIKRFVTIGDCNKPAKVKEAVHEAFFAVNALAAAPGQK